MSMREAVIVSTARTPIGRAFRGAFNDTKSPTLMAHAIEHAVRRSGLEGGVFEDAVIGTVLYAGTAGGGESCPQPRACAGPAGGGSGADHGPPVLLRPDGDRYGSQADHL